jgi:hypothetical protein
LAKAFGLLFKAQEQPPAMQCKHKKQKEKCATEEERQLLFIKPPLSKDKNPNS